MAIGPTVFQQVRTLALSAWFWFSFLLHELEQFRLGSPFSSLSRAPKSSNQKFVFKFVCGSGNNFGIFSLTASSVFDFVWLFCVCYGFLRTVFWIDRLACHVKVSEFFSICCILAFIHFFFLVFIHFNQFCRLWKSSAEWKNALCVRVVEFLAFLHQLCFFFLRLFGYKMCVNINPSMHRGVLLVPVSRLFFFECCKFLKKLCNS